MSPEELEELEQDFVAQAIVDLENETGLELTDEAIDAVVERADANRAEDGEPQVAGAFDEVLSEAETNGEIDYGYEDPREAMQQELAEMRAALNGDPDPAELEAIEAQQEMAEAAHDAWANDFQAELTRFEKAKGREFTDKEVTALAEDAGASDRLIDLKESWERVYGKGERDRRDVAAEVFDEEQAKGEESKSTEPEPEWEPPEDEPPKAPDMSNDEDRIKAMVHDFEEAEAA